MSLVVLLGGARSGKSQLALRLAERGSAPVVFLATGEALDEEMADRIERHRQERPAEWTTVEEPLELERAIAGAALDATLVVDCLSLWVSNVIERRPAAEIEAAGAAAADAAAARPGLTIAVTNEVGLGIVPDNALARSYRDVLGRVNALWVERAENAYFVAGGRTIELKELA
ncbi:MAG: adenosylcobinamide kinase / adenosylcobinamide-phosphate guanylyltransferase [Gaiellaceae bacterium]|nr:adenosylcobinamide kinase / adenosylcobinamide-phosphate guanylyltransferase [Gaiellaceae bacterium]